MFKEKDVKSRYEMRPRKPGEWRTPEQLVQAKVEALLWRAEWRHRKIREAEAEEEEQKKTSDTLPVPRAAPQRDELRDRANFACAVARAEFGRFYRNGKAE